LISTSCLDYRYLHIILSPEYLTHVNSFYASFDYPARSAVRVAIRVLHQCPSNARGKSQNKGRKQEEDTLAEVLKVDKA